MAQAMPSFNLSCYEPWPELAMGSNPCPAPATNLVALDAVVCVQAWGVVDAEVQGRLSTGHQGTAIQADGTLQEGGLHGGGGRAIAMAVGGGQGIPGEAGLVEGG